MVQQDILPPTKMAGIDAVGGESWSGITIEQAEQQNCQSDSQGDAFGDGTLVNSWGDNQEVWIKYNVATHKILWLTANKGYEGLMKFHSRDNKDQYVIQISKQILKNGQPFSLNWNDPPSFQKKVTELADAMFATFSPELPPEEVGTRSCFDRGHCTMTPFSDQGAIRLWSLGMHLWFQDPLHATGAVPSTPTRIDLRMPRLEPYSFADTTLKLDKEGPIALAKDVDGKHAGKDCRLHLGMTYKEFTSQCVGINGDPTKDKVYFNKLMGNMLHDTERFIFDSTGVDMNFTTDTVPLDDVLRDDSRPQDADLGTTLYVDASTLGIFTDDYAFAADGTRKLDLHGSGIVYREYARLVQSQINAALKAANPNAVTHELGDPACLFPNPLPDEYDPSTFHPAENCTGFEGFVTGAPKTGTNANLDRISLGVDVRDVIGPLGLKPGKPVAAFCMDPGDGLNRFCGADDVYGLQGAMWDTSFQRVVNVLGHGDLDRLPKEVQDRRFYFQQYFIALIKYFRSFASPLPVGQKYLTDISNVSYEPNSVFFDSEGSGQYEAGEYIDRTFAQNQPPIDVKISADILNGTLFDYSFTNNLTRPEEALYKAVLEKDEHNIGEENVTLTNLFGSPVLAAAYADHAAEGVAAISAYECATADWTTQAKFAEIEARCEGNLPPLDPTYKQNPNDPNSPKVMPLKENGQPILKHYPAAFGGHSTPFTLGSTALKVMKEVPNLQFAVVKIPQWQDPYDPKSGLQSEITVAVPWLPNQPGVGFPYPVSGERDKLVQTGALDFSGTTITTNIDYLPNWDHDANGKPIPPADGSIQILAVETKDFLGDIFICQDPVTGDILRTKMYGSVATMLDWIAKHPGVYDACGLIVRSSPYNNYPDFIFSTVNGVRVNVTAGGGYGRVNDATLYLPGEYQ